MLTKRVIPCLDVKDGRVVKGINFVSLRDAGDPVELASAYDREGADEVIFLDITATSDNRSTTIDMASRAADELAIPYTVGGGFRDLAGMRRMVAAGADKVSLNSAAVKKSPAHHPRCGGVWQPGGYLRHRRQARGGAGTSRGRQMGGLRSGRSYTHGARRGGVGLRGGAPRRGRDLADQHGPRRYQGGL